MSTLMKIVLVLVGIWIALAVIGFLIKGLFWLFVIACIAFGFTLAGSARRRGVSGRRF